MRIGGKESLGFQDQNQLLFSYSPARFSPDLLISCDP